jgi:hypothetical protein
VGESGYPGFRTFTKGHQYLIKTLLLCTALDYVIIVVTTLHYYKYGVIIYETAQFRDWIDEPLANLPIFYFY